MIELKINGITLPMPFGMKLSRELETNIFNREAENYDFTFPVDIPLTDDALVALKNPTSLSNTSVNYEYPADMFIDGLFVNRVTVKVLRISNTKRTASISIIGSFGTFARMIGTKKVSELTLGGVRTIGVQRPDLNKFHNRLINNNKNAQFLYTPCDSDVHMKDVNAGTIVTDYLFPTCIDTNPNSDLIHSGNEINVLNAWDIVNQKFLDPLYNQILIDTFDQFESRCRFFWVPFFRLAFVLRKCFEESGFTVTGSLMSDVKFNRILLYNTYSINRTVTSFQLTQLNDNRYTIVHYGTQIDPRNHVPAIPIVDFITEVGKAFNLNFNIDLRTRTVSIDRWVINSVSDNVIDLTEVADPEPDIVYEDVEVNQGYEFAYTYDANDSLSGENAKDDIFTMNIYTSVNAYVGLNGASRNNIPGVTGMTINDMVYVRSENNYYQWDGAAWILYSVNQGKHKTSNNEGCVQITTKCVPMVNGNFSIWTYNITTSNMIAQRQNGPVSNCGITGKGLLYILDTRDMDDQGKADEAVGVVDMPPIDLQPHLINWIGTASNYPFATSSCYSITGTLQNVYCLSWWTPDGKGLYPEWWKTFCDRVLNSITTEQKVLFNAYLFNKFNPGQQLIRINQLNYVCRKASIVMPFPAISTLILSRV